MILRELDSAGVGEWVTFVAPGNLDGVVAAVVGDFNGWNPTASPFLDLDGGRVVRVHLPAGHYRFRYLIGAGEWLNDADADNYVANEHGSFDCVIHVAAAPLGTGAPPPSHDQSRERDLAEVLTILSQLPAAKLHP